MMAEWETIGGGSDGWETVGRSHVDQIPGEVTPPAAPAKRMPFERLIGTGEAALSAATGIPAAIAGQVAGVARSVTSGKLGTDEGVRAGEETARNVSHALTYEPRTEPGKRIVRSVADALDTSKLAGLNPFDAAALTRAAGPVATRARAALPTAEEVAQKLQRHPAAEMVGVGAAETDPARIRRERAASLPVPIPLTKGQAERTFEQQRFERETAKSPVGAPLRERFADQNAKILQNFDAWVDQTEAAAPNLRATGVAVADALNVKVARAKEKIRSEYDRARDAGEMSEMVPTKDLAAYLENNRPESINAPILTSIEQKLVQLGGAAKDASGRLVPGQISINDLEEIRKMIGRLSDSTPTNGKFGVDVKRLIDATTAGHGGDVYKTARRLRAQYAREFENQGAIAKLLATKPGTTDRAVAFEDVFNHSVLNGSRDDVRAVRRTLLTAGDATTQMEARNAGQQAWKELQGQTVNYLKSEATKNVARDIKGNRIVSAAQLDKAVRDLDRDGKLELIFGKQGAQQIRDINELAADVYTSPPGAVNTSNSGSVVLEALSNLAVGKLPTAAAKAIGLVKSELGKRTVKKQIREALSQDDIDRAGAGSIKP